MDAIGRMFSGGWDRARAALVLLFVALLGIGLGGSLLLGCNRSDAGGPEAVADAFADAYFRQADQEAAKRWTAFGATKMLDVELREVSELRKSGFDHGEVKLNVQIQRGERTTRGKRVRFDYTLRYEQTQGAVTKHADIELAQVHDEWKVVRVGVTDEESKTP